MMKMRPLTYVLIAILTSALFQSCDQSEPPSFGRVGDVVSFSGYDWDVKHDNVLQGPGPNWFSNDLDDIYVDQNGYLHMHITERDGRWYATEVVSQDTMGYGTYTWTIEGDFVNQPDNIVVGLFTWDNNTFFEQANSELDVELAKWGEDKENTLQYAVQPVAFGPYYPERTNNPEGTEPWLIGVSTHEIHWTDSLVSFRSFHGEDKLEQNIISTWSFDLDNPARIKNEGNNSSEPVVIPEPGNTTNARINYWLLPWINEGPSDGERQEFIVRKFDFEPA